MPLQMEPITDASAWTGEDLARDQSWKFTLTTQQQDDLGEALQKTNKRGLPFAELTREDFPWPSLLDTLHNLQSEIRVGGGSPFFLASPQHRMITPI